MHKGHQNSEYWLMHIRNVRDLTLAITLTLHIKESILRHWGRDNEQNACTNEQKTLQNRARNKKLRMPGTCVKPGTQCACSSHQQDEWKPTYLTGLAILQEYCRVEVKIVKEQKKSGGNADEMCYFKTQEG